MENKYGKYFLLAFNITLLSCNSEHKKLSKSERENLIKSLDKFDGTIDAVAIKYGFEIDTIKNIINIYAKRHDVFLLTLPDSSDLSFNSKTYRIHETLNMIASKYNIPKETLGNIIYDYKLISDTSQQ